MWTISPEALAFLEKNGARILTVDQPVVVDGCCLQISEPPAVYLGEPKSIVGKKRNTGSYMALEVEGIRIHVPSYLSRLNLMIDLTRFFWKEKLVVEGWNLV